MQQLVLFPDSTSRQGHSENPTKVLFEEIRRPFCAHFQQPRLASSTMKDQCPKEGGVETAFPELPHPSITVPSGYDRLFTFRGCCRRTYRHLIYLEKMSACYRRMRRGAWPIRDAPRQINLWGTTPGTGSTHLCAPVPVLGLLAWSLLRYRPPEEPTMNPRGKHGSWCRIQRATACWYRSRSQHAASVGRLFRRKMTGVGLKHWQAIVFCSSFSED
ncbi:hypothetical protein EV126DRAFT_217023 [Verticillium dahliae]|nr:hypothetical protein EV126DRAFT_217023 [Verticillium dahliae]